MSRIRTNGAAVVLAVCAVAATAVAATPAAAEPGARATHRPVPIARTPPMGWSSWSALRGRISEAAIEAQADSMHQNLQSHGYRNINIDAGWSDHVDAYGRDTWDTTKFPDGIPAVASYVHHLGLKFGIYLVPGIKQSVVAANLPIYGTPYHAADIADTTTRGNTLTNAWRIDYSKPGAQEYIQSYADMLASWGVDYIKMDFVGPGGGNFPADNRADMAAWRYALDHSGRKIHLELSNSLSLAAADTWKQYTNGWRIDGDIECYSKCPGFLTSWDNRMVKRFTDAPLWVQYGSPGGWNDLDSVEVGNGDVDGITPDERQTMVTLWSIEASPLLLGTDLTKLDPADLPLITNDEVIRVDQAGHPAHPVSQATPQQVWFSDNHDGTYTVALFNLATTPAAVTANWSDLGVHSHYTLARDLWSHRNLGILKNSYTTTLPAHGSALLKIRPLPF
jgi:alpha-galactosidase